eukprot:CAMPEP_0171496948 /NCGR_PEP_ID=MMETSP0958-20121227/6989_1 /TAXON_ID=87120 /ORGANISM="Aurantiochytrium limacinum, Strain ATCCMYA-1381" /LENGTH=732 /DNA_ID=CAMNT_0012031115 /DNA_START=408 /DNA_END=2607 /DNA_ORIENTATION=-
MASPSQGKVEKASLSLGRLPTAVLLVCLAAAAILSVLGELPPALRGQNESLTASTAQPHLRTWWDQDDSRFLQDSTTTSESCAAVSCHTASLCTCSSEPVQKSVGQMAYEWILIVLLVCMSALFSGLTLGLMSLDKIGLEIVIGGDPESTDAKNARKIQPIREHGNLLLCTLLLGNVAVNSLLSILMADYTGGTIGFIVSTGVIVIFGEILPQAACSRHALAVGSRTIYIVKFFMIVMYPITKPLSLVLDFIFREEIGAIYSSKQLGTLLEIHVKHQQIDEEQARMMGGAMTYKAKLVKDVMTKKESMFMLPASQVLDFETMSKIFQHGYSRIPVYQDGDRNKIVGLLLTKDLILIDPEDCTTVSSVIQFFGRPVYYLWPETKVSEALALFRSGRAHLAIVNTVNDEDETRDPFYEVSGLITLEDIIEEILQEEILDETDSIEEITRAGLHGADERVDRATFDFARLRLLDSNRRNTLSSDEVRAIVAHLCTNVRRFHAAVAQGLFTTDDVQDLVKDLVVLELMPNERLYIKGKPLTHCTLLLSGKMGIVSGTEGFVSDAGPWSVIGQSALDPDLPEGHPSDFSATVTSEDGARCIRINRFNFDYLCQKRTEALEAAKLETSDSSSKIKTSRSNSSNSARLELKAMSSRKVSDSEFGSPAEVSPAESIRNRDGSTSSGFANLFSASIVPNSSFSGRNARTVPLPTTDDDEDDEDADDDDKHEQSFLVRDRRL